MSVAKSGANALGDSLGIKAVETADRSFGDHDAGAVDPEVVAAMDHARQPVHDEAVPARGPNVEDDIPAGANRVVGPAVVREHGTPVFGP
jgi:hypothetical protein